MKNFSLFLLIILTLCSLNSCLKNKAYDVVNDVVIYGATSAGIIAAVETARSGKTVIIINPNDHIGGLTTGGLGSTDIGNKKVIGGISREFYQRIKKYYENPDNWKWQKPSEYLVHGEPLDLTKEDAFWYFEPSAAMSVYQDFISEYQIPLLTDERLDLEKGVTMVDGKIIEITMESGKSFKGKMFIDATYEGDLMAVAGVSYTYGRESNSQYNETLNGVQTQRGKYHQFPDGIDPYMEPGNPESGLLPNINKDVGVEGTGDKKIQAYNFRLCLTDIPENRVDVEKPENYNELEYELLFRYFENGDPYRALYARGMMPNRKTDVNNGGPFSTDFIGRNYDYPEGDYAKREEIIAEHKEYHLGLLWTLANHPRVPEKYRNEYKKWGLAKDEYVSYGNFTPQIYVREARRMVSDYVMTELHCRQAGVSAEQSIGMGAYTMDSHHVQRYVNEDGWVKNEGDVQVGGFKPYPIDYRSIVPKKNECRNLLVPVCLSATHIAFGSIRMEPVFMVLGQSAALAACLAIDEKIPVQDIDYEVLKTILLEKDVILKYPD